MFNGKDYVAEMGLYDYRHRWYQPQLGRFLQVDPKGFDAGDENLFRYCLDDPVDRTDPEGLESPGGAAERAAEIERNHEAHGMVQINSGYADGITGTNGARMAASGSDLAQQYGPQPSLTFAQVSREVAQKGGTSGKNFEQQAHGAAVKMVAEETHNPDVTQTGLITSGPPGRIGPIQERIGPSDPMNLESKRQAREVMPPVPKGQEAMIIHYHSRTGTRYGPPSDVDLTRVKTRTMYFTNRDLAKTGEYLIYRRGQSEPEVHYSGSIIP